MKNELVLAEMKRWSSFVNAQTGALKNIQLLRRQNG
jgi:hypothetical protein